MLTPRVYAAQPVNVANGRSGKDQQLPHEGEPTPAPAIAAPAIDTSSGSGGIPSPISAHDETVIFVDWDDTLLCTHELIERQNIDIDRCVASAYKLPSVFLLLLLYCVPN